MKWVNNDHWSKFICFTLFNTAGDSNVNSIEEFLKEAIVMKDFKHPNVLPLLGVVIKENIPLVILPFMDNGDLKTFVSNDKNVSNLNSSKF